MANHSQHQQGSSAGPRGGAGQTIVELCGVSASGLVFWSRQRFEIGSELQIRVRRDALASLAFTPPGQDSGPWVSLRGYVVECPAVRRAGGEHGFEVSLLLDIALSAPPKPKAGKPVCPRLKHTFPGLKRVGLN